MNLTFLLTKINQLTINIVIKKNHYLLIYTIFLSVPLEL